MTQPTPPASHRPILILVTAIAAIWFSGRAWGDGMPLAYDGRSIFYSDDAYGRAPVSIPAAATNVTVVVQPSEPAVFHLVRPDSFGTHRRRLSRYDRYIGHDRHFGHRVPVGFPQSPLGGPILVDTRWNGR